MNKVIVALICILVIIGAIFTAVIVYEQKENSESEKVEAKVSEEEILDDCTEEYDAIESEQSLKANSEEVKTSPNCSVITKTYYKKCGHTRNQYSNLPENSVNLTKEQIQEQYKDSEIESFASNEIVLYKEKEGECGEHYLVKDKDGIVAIYEILEDGTEKEVEITDVSTEYLPETDKINMKNGIKVNGRQELNQLIEDFE